MGVAGKWMQACNVWGGGVGRPTFPTRGVPRLRPPTGSRLTGRACGLLLRRPAALSHQPQATGTRLHPPPLPAPPHCLSERPFWKHRSSAGTFTGGGCHRHRLWQACLVSCISSRPTCHPPPPPPQPYSSLPAAARPTRPLRHCRPQGQPILHPAWRVAASRTCQPTRRLASEPKPALLLHPHRHQGSPSSKSWVLWVSPVAGPRHGWGGAGSSASPADEAADPHHLTAKHSGRHVASLSRP